MTSPAGTGRGVSTTRIAWDGEQRWLRLLAVLTAVELAWWATAYHAGIAPAPFVGTYLALTSAALVAALGLRLVFARGAERSGWPAVAMGTVLIALGASLFLPLKYAIPGQIPFWLDAPLAGAERALFGADPWRIVDRLIGWALVPVDRVYGLWLPVQSVALFSVMLLPPSPAKSRALIAYSLAWFALGVVAATVLSSAGPIFYDRLMGGHAFAALTARLASGDAWMVRGEADAMWASLASRRPGFVAGISAMPSLHVAISVWLWLAARALAPRLAPLAFGYAMFIAVASVQLGWHYVSDGVAGALGMGAMWWLAARLSAKS